MTALQQPMDFSIKTLAFHPQRAHFGVSSSLATKTLLLLSPHLIIRGGWECSTKGRCWQATASTSSPTKRAHAQVGVGQHLGMPKQTTWATRWPIFEKT